LENEEKLSAQLITDKAAQKRLTARQTTQATNKRHNVTMPTPGHASIGQKRIKVSYLLSPISHTVV